MNHSAPTFPATSSSIARTRFPLLVLIAVLLSAARVEAQETSVPTIDFERDVAPIFAKHCADCHGVDTQEGALRLDRASALRGGDSGEPLLVPHEPDRSHLWLLVTGAVAGERMPPDGDGLNDDELSVVRRWIEQGGGWPSAAGDDEAQALPWSFQPIQVIAAPALGSPADAGPIDRWLTETQRQRGLHSVSRAADRDWLQRASLIVTGLRPTREELDRFEQQTRPDARAREIERLLASPGFGERWARHWLDVVRFAETSGFETNVPRPDAYPYRDWVIRSFNDDLPVDQFMRAQIAGDSFGQDEATAFLVGGAWDQVKSSDPILTANQRQDELADMINTTGTAFFGLTLGCARCHNHKFDPISQQDYYAMQAILAGVQHGSRPYQPQLSEEQKSRRLELAATLEHLESQLREWESPAVPVVPFGTRLIDDALGFETAQRLVPPVGTTPLVDDELRGGRRDAGASDRLPEIGGGYTWWNNEPGKPLARYRVGQGPRTPAQVRLWVSWGCGFTTHSPNAEYWWDQDGNWETDDDRTLLATVNQQNYADGSQPPASQIRTSGFKDLGVVTVYDDSALFLVGGVDGSAITADALIISPVLNEQEAQTAAAEQSGFESPRIRAEISSRMNELRFAPIEADRVRFTILASNQSEPCVDELEVWSVDGTNVALQQGDVQVRSGGDLQGYEIHQLAHLNDGKYGNSHSWISDSVGAGWVEIRWNNPALIDRVVWGRDREGAFADRTATEYVIEVAQGDGAWMPIADHRSHAPNGSTPAPWLSQRFAGAPIEERDAITSTLAELENAKRELASFGAANQTVYAGRFETPPTVLRLFRGDVTQPREAVEPAVPEVLGSLVTAPTLAGRSEAQRRLEFAQWMVSAEQPLVWRVMANRLWYSVFGRGLVSTPSDFGRNGGMLSHPELLDYLANQLRAERSFKSSLRQMLVSEAFGRAATPDPAMLEVDSEAVYLWRFPPRRLEAEAIRDTLLDATGALRRTMFGPGYSVFEPNDNYVRNYIPLTQFGPETWRRMIYMTKVRMEQDPVFGLFDVPDAGQVAPRRTVSTTPLQALNLFNSPLVLEQSQRLAQELMWEAPDAPQERIRLAFSRVLKRDPTELEFHAAQDLVAKFGENALIRALWNSNEFLTIP